MKNILLTGFGVYGPHQYNPVIESTHYFNGEKIGNCLIEGLILSCTYRRSFAEILQAIDRLQPVAIIQTGLSSRVQGISIETAGYNWMDGDYPDADGFDPTGEKVLEGGPESILVQSDAEKFYSCIAQSNIPTVLSDNPGRFICNSSLYLIANYIVETQKSMQQVFIHTPWTENFKDRVVIDPTKIFLPQRQLFQAIEEIVKEIDFCTSE